MTVREYIGARYVPLFMGDWQEARTYEPLSIVTYQGNSYTSRKFVTAGVVPTNEEYWALTGNYNAQIEQYRQEVRTYSGRIETLEEEVDEIDSTLQRVTAKRLIVFGDSWCTASKHWMDYYVSGKNYDSFKTYGVTGAAFITRPNNTIASQLTTADSDATIDKNEVAEVVIIGGVNDFRDDSGIVVNNLISEIVDVMAAADAMYPNAIVKFYLNCELNGYSNNLYMQIARMYNRGYNMYSCVPCVAYITPAYESDGLHLNATGDRLLATYMLTGNVIPWDITELVDASDIVSSNTAVSLSNLQITKKPHSIGVQFMINCTENDQTATITFPEPLRTVLFNRNNSVLFTYADNGTGKFGFTGGNLLNCRHLDVGDSYISMECNVPW